MTRVSPLTHLVELSDTLFIFLVIFVEIEKVDFVFLIGKEISDPIKEDGTERCINFILYICLKSLCKLIIVFIICFKHALSCFPVLYIRRTKSRHFLKKVTPWL
jgi:hypothetical protein